MTDEDLQHLVQNEDMDVDTRKAGQAELAKRQRGDKKDTHDKTDMNSGQSSNS